MQERFEISDREEFLEPGDFGRKISQDLVNMINGHPQGDAGRISFNLLENIKEHIPEQPHKKKQTDLFDGLHLNQLIIVKSGVYAISGSSENYKAGLLDDNAVLTKYFDPATNEWRKTKNGYRQYRLLTPASYHFESRRMSKVMKLNFNPNEIILLPREFDTLKVNGEQKRREIEKIKAGIRK